MSLRLPILPVVSSPGSPPLPGPSKALATVQALEALWQHVASRPLWAPPHFWRYIRLRWRSRLDQLRPERMQRVGPVGKVNDCRSCTHNCCVGPHATVLLRLKDIATLKDIGRLDLLTSDKPQFSSAELEARPALRMQIHSYAWRVFPVLKKDSMGACMALNKQGSCSLYPHWPLTCARFPYALHEDTQTLFYSRRCQSFWIHPQAEPRASAMAVAAVASYNERIKDLVLLEYAPERLADLGLLEHLTLCDTR